MMMYPTCFFLTFSAIVSPRLVDRMEQHCCYICCILVNIPGMGRDMDEVFDLTWMCLLDCLIREEGKKENRENVGHF